MDVEMVKPSAYDGTLIIMSWGEQHVIALYGKWTNDNGVRFTNWESVCGKKGTETGSNPRFHGTSSIMKKAYCKECAKTNPLYR